MRKSLCIQLVFRVVKICLVAFFIMVNFASASAKDAMIRAGYPTDIAESLEKTMDKAGFTSAQKMETATMLTNQSHDTMLAVSFRQKIEEGVLKNAGSAVIVHALEKVKSRHEAADNFVTELGVKTTDKNLRQTVVDCLTAGLTPEDALKIQTSFSKRDTKMTSRTVSEGLIVETMLTAREMVRQGVQSSTAASILGNAVQNGEQVQAIQTLRNSFRNRHGVEASVLANRYGYALKNGFTISQASQNGFSNSGKNTASGQGSNGGNGSGGSGDSGSGSGGSGNGGNGNGNSGDSGNGNSGSGGSGGSSGGNGSGSGGNGGNGNGSGGPR